MQFGENVLTACESCGATIDHRDAFCAKCGELTDRGKGPSELAGRYAAKLADGLGKLIAAALAYVTNPENRKKVGIGAGVALLLLIAMTNNPISRGVGSIFASTPDALAFNDDGTPNFAEYEDVFVGDETEYLITGPANIRDFPTSQGTSVVGSLAEGETVMAREVRAFDPDSQWLKLTTGGYVWGSNLIALEKETTEPGQAAVEFPDNLRGRWSSMDTCRGWDMNAEIIISANSISFYETSGRLTAITDDERGNPIYQLAMSGEGETWTDSYAINITANGFSIILDRIGTPGEPSLVYHNPEAGCGRVFFED